MLIDTVKNGNGSLRGRTFDGQVVVKMSDEAIRSRNYIIFEEFGCQKYHSIR